MNKNWPEKVRNYEENLANVEQKLCISYGISDFIFYYVLAFDFIRAILTAIIFWLIGGLGNMTELTIH